MLRDPVISVSPDAVPIVRVIAIFLENAAKARNIADRMLELEGTMAFKSTVDKQAASVCFKFGQITVNRGVASDAIITAELDLNWSIYLEPEIALHGAMDYPKFAEDMRLVFARHAFDWREAAGDFWARYGNRNDLPQALRAECSDDGRDLVLGKGSIQVHLIGSSNALASVFNCSSMLIRSIMTGEIHAVGELKYLTTLSGVYFDRVTGDLS